jgi:hypothetical protein
MNDLLKAAEEVIGCIERNPGGYDFRPYFSLRRTSQLYDTDGAVIRLMKAVENLGGHVSRELAR